MLDDETKGASAAESQSKYVKARGVYGRQQRDGRARRTKTVILCTRVISFSTTWHHRDTNGRAKSPLACFHFASEPVRLLPKESTCARQSFVETSAECELPRRRETTVAPAGTVGPGGRACGGGMARVGGCTLYREREAVRSLLVRSGGVYAEFCASTVGDGDRNVSGYMRVGDPEPDRARRGSHRMRVR